MKTVYTEIFPQTCIDDILLLKERLEIHKDSNRAARYIPTAYPQRQFLAVFHPLFKKSSIFRKIRAIRSEVRTYEYDTILDDILQSLRT